MSRSAFSQRQVTRSAARENGLICDLACDTQKVFELAEVASFHFDIFSVDVART